MRILSALPLLFLAALFLGACESGGGNDAKIAVADVSRLMGDSVPGKAGIKFLEDRRAKFQTELDGLQDKLKNNPNDEALMGELQKALAASQQQLQAEGQNVAALLFDTLQRVLDKFREAEGYALILGQDTVASFAKSADVTDAVMRELDKEVIDFKPLPQAAPAGAAPALAPGEPAQAPGEPALEIKPDGEKTEGARQGG